MKIASVNVAEVTVGKNEAGMFEFVDTGKTIEAGDKAFLIKTENPMSGETDKMFFADRTKAEQYN